MTQQEQERRAIEKAATIHANEYWGENYMTECKNYNMAGFKAGAEFALSELREPFTYTPEKINEIIPIQQDWSRDDILFEAGKRVGAKWMLSELRNNSNICPECGYLIHLQGNGIAERLCTCNHSEPSENVGQLACNNYEQDNTTAMNCIHCGKSKWVHGLKEEVKPPENIGQTNKDLAQKIVDIMNENSDINESDIMYLHSDAYYPVATEIAQLLPYSQSGENGVNVVSKEGAFEGQRFAEWAYTKGWNFRITQNIWARNKERKTTSELYTSPEFLAWLKQFEK
jgi:hypothetical protein